MKKKMERKNKIIFLIRELELLRHETIETLHTRKQKQNLFKVLNYEETNGETIKDLTTRKNIISEIIEDLEKEVKK